MKYREFDRRARELAHRPWTDSRAERRLARFDRAIRVGDRAAPRHDLHGSARMGRHLARASRHQRCDPRQDRADLSRSAPSLSPDISSPCWSRRSPRTCRRSSRSTCSTDTCAIASPTITRSDDACGYVAALFPDRSVACEWEWLGKKRLPNATIPSLIEFSVYAGIHRIDGKPTGLLPDDDLPPLAIGIARERFRD